MNGKIAPGAFFEMTRITIGKWVVVVEPPEGWEGVRGMGVYEWLYVV